MQRRVTVPASASLNDRQIAPTTQNGCPCAAGVPQGCPAAARGTQPRPPSVAWQKVVASHGAPPPHAPIGMQVPPDELVQAVPGAQIIPLIPPAAHGWPAPGAGMQVPALPPVWVETQIRSPVQPTTGVAARSHGCPCPA